MANSYKFKVTALATTSQTTLLSADTNETIIIKSIIVTNNTGNTPTVTLDVTGGGSSYTIDQSGIYDNTVNADFDGDNQDVDITQSD